MDTTGLHNLSLALRHILQQFMDSSNSSYYKNADMTLPHDGYFQRLSWYFECDKCHYKAFYIREIENHRKVCGEIKLNEIHPGFSDVRGAANNIRRTNATSIPAARVSEGFQEELVATPHNIYTPAQDSGTPQSIAPTALVDIKTESQINMESVDFSGSGKRKKPKPKGAKRKSMKISGVSTTPCASSEKPQEVASRDFSSADSSTNNQNPWESFEHILVSADGDTKEFASQPGKVRKVRKGVVCHRWTKAENDILNAIHPQQTEMPSREIMKRLCEALPGRSKCVIRAKASNNRKLLLRIGLNRPMKHSPTSPNLDQSFISPDFNSSQYPLGNSISDEMSAENVSDDAVGDNGAADGSIADDSIADVADNSSGEAPNNSVADAPNKSMVDVFDESIADAPNDSVADVFDESSGDAPNNSVADVSDESIADASDESVADLSITAHSDNVNLAPTEEL
ncbi:uncharacterized protein [Watersipora subatra]|uniref:uncharacterized protein isoform X2 n=1 Tax=Watersipora subatra TaxID=2589382 RepID=UPI00355B202F